MKKLLAVPAVALGAAFAAQPALANDTYTFDTVHSQILFFVDHGGLTMSQGEFLEFDGTVLFDPEAPENGSVEVTIDTASIDMDFEPWNNHMRSADFFDVANHPSMTFRSTDIEVTGENTALITGDLTMIGETNPVTLDVTFNRAGDFRGTFKAGFSATGMLDRTDWGMDFGVGGIGTDVELRIEAELERQ